MRHRKKSRRFSNAAGREFRNIEGLPEGSVCQGPCMCLNVGTQSLSSSMQFGTIAYPNGTNNPGVCNFTCPPCTGANVVNVSESQLLAG